MNQTFEALHSSCSDSVTPAIVVGADYSPAPRYSNIDRAGMEPVPISRVELGRLILLATEVGSRFCRDAIAYDAAAWMVAPRRLFGGRAAIDACREEMPFMHGMLLHRLSYGLDADPAEMDSLLDGDAPHPSHDVAAGAGLSGFAETAPADDRLPELYTAIIADETEGNFCQVFHATVAFGPEDVLAQLQNRVGQRLAEQAWVAKGFDPSHPVSCAQVSPAIGELLHDVAVDPSSLLAKGLTVHIEHRFVA